MNTKTLLKASLLSLSLITLQSCSTSHWDKNHRTLASVEERAEILENPHLLSHFDELFNREDALEFFINAFKDHEELYYYNQAMIYAYDDALKENIDPMETPLYEELWDGRDLKEHADETLSFYLIRLDDLSRNGTPEQADKASYILESITMEMEQLEEHQKVAYLDVIEHFRRFEVRDHSGRKSHTAPNVTVSFDQFRGNHFSWEDFYQNNSDSLKAEVAKRYDRNRMRAKYRDNNGRAKRIIYPSTERAGNLIGSIITDHFPSGTWAITYDDGPHPTRTASIVNMYANAGLKASFFWLAKNAERNPEMIRLAKEKGMELANHSYSHANLVNESRTSQHHEIVESTQRLEQLYGRKVRFFRLPYGSGVNNANLRQMIADREMIHTFWNVDSLDWQDRDPQLIYNRVVTQMERLGKGIILFHDIHNQTVDTTRLLLNYIEQRNSPRKTIHVKTLAEIVDGINNTTTTTPVVTTPPVVATPTPTPVTPTPVRPAPTPTPVRPAGPYITTNLNVRVGPSTEYYACAVLPTGTQVRILRQYGSFYEIQVVNPNNFIAGELRNCFGRHFVSSRYVAW